MSTFPLSKFVGLPLPPILFIVMILLGIIAIIGFGTKILKRRRDDVWQLFARKHHLSYSQSEFGPLITGRVAGRNFTLGIQAASSDTGPMGIEEISMTVSLDNSEIPSDLQIHSAIGIVGELQRTLEPHRVQTNDENFDKQLVIASESPNDVLHWLTEKRRSTLIQLTNDHTDKQVRFNAKELTLQTRSAISQIEQLDAMFNSLQTAIHSIEN